MTTAQNPSLLLIEALRDAERFSRRVRDGSTHTALVEGAVEQINMLTHLISAVELISVHEGRDVRLDGAYTAEIVRRPQLEDRPFSCTPIFIIGSRRSGTTLLAQLINASSNIFALPENWLAGTMASCDALIDIGHTLKRTLREPFPTYLWRLGRMCDEVYSEHAHRNGKSRWVSKELFIPHRLDLLDAMFDYRPHYVYAVRHGFDVADSCAARFPGRDGMPLNGVTSLNVETYLREWIANNSSTKDFHDRNPDRCLMVRYEDLVARPHAKSREIFDFLGEDWDDDILDNLGESRLAPGMGDTKIYGLGGRIVGARSHWESSWPPPLLATLGRLANPMLARLGYQSVPANR